MPLPPRPLFLSARVLLLVAFCLTSLSCKKTPDEDIIRAHVQAALTAVNEKKPADVVEHAADDFKGPRKADLRETRRTITGFLLTRGWVRALERKLDVTVEGDTAHVDLEVVLAEGKAIEKIEDVVPTNATVLDVDLDLERRDDEWLFVRGEYRHVRF